MGSVRCTMIRGTSKQERGPCLDRCLAFALANSQFNFAGRIAVVTGGSIGTGRAGAVASAVAAPRLSAAIKPAGCQNGCEDEHEHDSEGTHRPPPSFSSFVH